MVGAQGDDKFVIQGGLTESTADIITDFSTTQDKIAFGISALLAGNFSKAVGAVADFTAALAAANLLLTNINGVVQVNVQEVDGSSYVFYNDGIASGADQVVKLTGTPLANIAFADIAVI